MKNRMPFVLLAVMLAVSVGFVGCTSEGVPEISISNLSISSDGEVLSNDTVTISVNVRNTGDAQGSYNVVLKIDGIQETSETVTLGPGNSQDVTFDVLQQEVGEHTVSVGNLSGSFSVYPPLEDPDPSYRVGTFYYPWYGNPEFDERWWHWTQEGATPPDDISSDYYPVLGAYSVTDPFVVAQHMAWLRRAGIGVIISSWWGTHSFEDRAVPLLLDMAARYGIKVAFHIEPYTGRSANGVVQDVQYIYERYGSHPAFFRTTASTRWSTDNRPKGVFFLWAAICADFAGGPCPVADSYWQEAMDTIHSLTEGAIVIGNGGEDGAIVSEGHFDGNYNYVTLAEGDELNFDWALSVPARSLYVPSVTPGFSARRIGYSEDTYLPRLDGNTYIEQWSAALAAGIEPWMVAITSFNEWHEGTQIEPAAENKNDGEGYDYLSYSPLSEDGYLTLTKQLSEEFLGLNWTSITSYPVRFEISTTSDFTHLQLVSGGRWGISDVISVSEEVEVLQFVDNRITLIQPIDIALEGNEVRAVVDMLLVDLSTDESIVFEIDRGHLGFTRVVVSILARETWVVIDDFVWDGIVPGPENILTVEIASEEIMSPS